MIKKISSIIIFFLAFISSSFSENNVYIKYKVDNEIVTNIDIKNEENYLIALNNELKNVTEKELYKLSSNSINGGFTRS